ncbi:hypothetical protein L914_03311, partial [Phytophthora nicotianae]
RNNGSHCPAACKSSSTLRLGSHKRIVEQRLNFSLPLISHTTTNSATSHYLYDETVNPNEK